MAVATNEDRGVVARLWGNKETRSLVLQTATLVAVQIGRAHV